MATKAPKASPTDPQVFTQEDGSKAIALPVAGVEFSLRSPKGRDLKAIAQAAKGLSEDPDTTEIDLLIRMLGILSGEPEDFFLDLDAEDLEAAGKVLSSFRAFRKPE